MKSIICSILCAAMLLCLLGCSQPPVSTDTPQTSGVSIDTQPSTSGDTQQDLVAVYEAPLAAISLPPVKELHYNDSNGVIASYTHQNVSITLPDADVAEAVELDLLNRIDKTRPAAERVFTTATADYSGQANWFPYSYSIAYQPMRLDQNVLSLFGAETSFDGTPLSLNNAISANYDLTTGTALTLRTILHEENFADALCELIISGLLAQKDTLFDDYASVIEAKFSTNVPVESWYFSNNGLCFYFAPYEIAPHSAGTVVSEIPYDKLSGLLKDAYFPAEKTAYSGVILTKTVTDTKDLESFSQFAEVSMDQPSDKLLIYSQGSVSNVRLHYTAENGSEIFILGMAGIGPKDAILAELSLDWAMENLKITFDSYGQTQTLTLTQNEDGTLAFSK